MTALAEAIEDRVSEVDDEHRRMVHAIVDHLTGMSLLQFAGWADYVTKVVNAHRAGDEIGPLIEQGYGQVLLERRTRGRGGPPQTVEDWREAIVFESADEIRKRAAR